MNGLTGWAGLDDWQVVCQFLPSGWEEAARTLGAIRRTRAIPNAKLLLRVLLVHLVDGCSLQETALRADQAGWCSLSAVAVFKRLRASEHWLRWMAERLWRSFPTPPVPTALRVRAVDATTVQEYGNTGTDWRVHFAIDLLSLQCDHFELTDVHGGETFRRIPVRAGDVLLGDRGYSTPPGVASVIERQGHVIVRVHLNGLPLQDKSGRRLAVRQRLRGLRVGQIGEWFARVEGPTEPLDGRLVAIKLGRVAARLARQRQRHKAAKKQRTVSRVSRFLAGYVLLWTDLPAQSLAAGPLLELYRLRWQIELTFKRMKSILGLGQLPKTSDGSARAWLQGKLLVAMLMDRLLEAADRFSPWGYAVAPASESMA
ncbi:MAG TPA: IS4 family transposase [Fimbriiglobus sp.]